MKGIISLNESCCGCGACVAICPVGCIDITEDEFGFLYPSVDESLCIKCDLCDQVCPSQSHRNHQEPINVLWAAAKDEDLKNRSSSGGLFGLFAVKVIKDGGAVYGAAFYSNNREVKHRRVEIIEDLDNIMRSKYLQSYIASDIYSKIVEDLESGRQVLFAGTACQVNAVNNYVSQKNVSPEGLITIDVICHGVPSPKLWENWADWVSKNEESEILCMNFRSKSTGWLTFSLSYQFESEKVSAFPFSSDWYMKAFLNNASLRPSCFQCTSKRTCGSDMTLGDFWGFNRIHPDIDCSQGISAVICNTAQGFRTFGEHKALMNYGVATYGEVLAGNLSLEKCVHPYGNYKDFMNDIASGCDIEMMQRKWRFKASFRKRIVRRIRILIKKILRPDFPKLR